MRSRLNLDLKDLQYVGKRYEDEYGGWLTLFRTLAIAPEPYSCIDVPNSWASLVYYLGHEIESVKPFHPEDALVPDPLALVATAEARNLLRELVEMHSALRPELVDALYKSDVEWDTRERRHLDKKEFKVTSNGSLHRPEVMHYLKKVLTAYTPSKDRTRCVLVPCAADKPYPAPLHTAVRESIPADFEIIIATGVLGLVPESLWDVMPLYDSGMPYEWRLMNIVQWYFSKFRDHYGKIVVYSDFYSPAIQTGLMRAGYPMNQVVFVFPPIYYEQYVPLLDDSSLSVLSEVTHGKKKKG